MELDFDLSKEETQCLYDYYLKNLEIMKKFSNFIFLHPKDLVCTPTSSEWEKCSKHDEYVNIHKNDKKGLGIDIMNNGTFWSINACEVDGTYYVYQGNHRVESAKICDKLNIWKGKLPVLVIPPYAYRIIRKFDKYPTMGNLENGAHIFISNRKGTLSRPVPYKIIEKRKYVNKVKVGTYVE